jgi:HEAT repeat protein
MSDDKHGQGKTYDALNARGLTAKREYVRGLEQRRDPEAISLLVECLCDESWYLRKLAEEAFLHLGEEGAAVLLPLLEQGLWFTRSSAALVLGQLGYAPAVPGLMALAEDKNRTVADAARDALLAVGRASGAPRIAHELHRMPPDRRQRRMGEITSRDPGLAERIARLMTNEEVMGVEDADALTDDHPVVRASEDGFEWEVLTSPPPPKPDGRTTSPPGTGTRAPGRGEDGAGPGA